MAVLIQCPACQRKLNVPDNLLGKRVKCPSCGEGFQAAAPPTAPAPAPAPKKPPAPPRDAISSTPPKPPPLVDYEVIDEPEYEKPRPSRKAPRDEEDDEDRPSRRRSRRDDDDDEDDRPTRSRRRRGDDDDDDDDEVDVRRRRRRARPHRGGLVVTMGIVSLIAWCCPILGWIVGGIALNMANTDLAAMNVGRMDDTGRPLTSAGRICAIIGLALSTLNAIAGVILRLTNRF